MQVNSTSFALCHFGFLLKKKKVTIQPQTPLSRDVAKPVPTGGQGYEANQNALFI